MISVKQAIQLRAKAIRDRDETARSCMRAMLYKNHRRGIHLSGFVSMLGRMMGERMTNAGTLRYICEVYPGVIYCNRARRAPAQIRRRMVRGVSYRVKYARLASAIEGDVEVIADPVRRNPHNYMDITSSRIGTYRQSVNWADFAPVEKLVFEDWADTRQDPRILAKRHGLQLDTVKTILTKHRARARVLA